MARYTGKKFSRSYVKGLRSGAQAAKRAVARHGCESARRDARTLAATIDRHSNDFQRGQTVGFSQVVYKGCGRHR